MTRAKRNTSPDTPTVFVVDDDEAMRESLEFLIRSAGLRVEAFDSAEAFLARCDASARGCLVLDVRMPGMSGPELQRELAGRRIGLPVILLTAHGDVPMAVRAMREHAFDFLEKPCDDRVLLDRIHQAIEHEQRTREASETARDVEGRVASLSPREREVLGLVTEGMLNKQIAAALGISIKTVEVHRARVMEKMRADSLAELVRMVTLLDRPNPPAATREAE